MPLTSEFPKGSPHDAHEIAGATQQLIAIEPRFGRIIERFGLPPTRRSEQGLAGLLRLVTFQSISTKAAAAIWQRLEEVLSPYHAADILSVSQESLQQAGLTRIKAQSFLGLATACQSGSLNLDAIAQQADETAISSLCQHKGIGRWTAQLYLLSALGRPDIMPDGDLALTSAAGDIFAPHKQLSASQLKLMARAWQPWRSVAALILWQAYRGHQSSGKG